MFHRKMFVVLIAVMFLLGCGKSQEPEQGRIDEIKERQEKGQEHPDEKEELIKLNKEAIGRAGIEIGVVSLRPLKVEYTFSGRVSVNEMRLAHIGPRIPGRVIEVYANLGDDVEKGMPLAMIDSPELGEAQSQYLKARTAFEIAEKSYERAKIILEGKVISTGEFQRREGEFISAKTELKATEDRLHLLGMTDEEILDIGREHTINSRVAIYAPLSGTIIEKHITLGEVVEPVKPLFTIVDLSSLWVIADIPEGDIPKIEKGQDVAVTVSPYPEKVFKGSISYIAEVIDPETRTVKVRAEVANPIGLLKPEMFAMVRISTSDKKDVLTIPGSAIQRDGDKTIVFVEKGEAAFEKRAVEIGPEVDGFHPVVSGLKVGERVVIKGAFTVKSEAMKGEMEHGH